MKSTAKKPHPVMDQKIKQHSLKFAGSLAGLVMLSFSAPTFAGWEVQWIDKFEGTGVNWDNWTAQTNAYYNNEEQCYTDDDSTANKNYDVSDGTLKIIARKQAINCPGLNYQTKTWTSGRLNSKDKKEFLYGRIESRIKFHNLEGGTWPAFWMLENRIGQQPIKGDGDSAWWPNTGAGEIDIWEWFSNEPNTYITNFFNEAGKSAPYNTGCGSLALHDYPNGSADVQDWHNYAMEWSKDNIDFYIDETLVVSQDMSSCSQYQEPMFVLLNVAMGGMLGGRIDSSLTKATMEVDYVAHCSASNENSATYCNEAIAPVEVSLVAIDDVAMNIGDAVTVTISASEAGLSFVSGTVNGVRVTDFTDNGNSTYSATYTVAEGDTAIGADSDIPVSFVLADANGNNSAVYNTAISQSSDAINTDTPTDTPIDTPADTPVDNGASDSSGGSLSQTLLLGLGLIAAFRRKRKGQSA